MLTLCVLQTLLYLMRRSYAYVYALLISSEPVSEALLPIYNQLQTLRRCLLEVEESGGVSTSRELYPYSMKVGFILLQPRITRPPVSLIVEQLNSIDDMRVDGKFLVGHDIPEGQGRVNELLAECYDIVWKLRTTATEVQQEEGGQ